MTQIRGIQSIKASQPTIEGAGVRLRRAFGFREATAFDPFLLLDDFRGPDPAHYEAGFPWHPHRGIETITYMLEGQVEHGDSLGHRGVIGAGDVQWMTAGRGIIHQEMPKAGEGGRMGGFQLWANLPASHKMMPPRYREVAAAQIPRFEQGKGVECRLIAGQLGGEHGPIQDVVTAPLFVDVTVAPETSASLPIDSAMEALAYTFEGRAEMGNASSLATVVDGSIVRFGPGDVVSVRTGKVGVRFLLCAGRPLREPVSWRGPIVMNTEEELDRAFAEYRSGTFMSGPPQDAL
ncbi:MAG: pirin family protein [Myxococcota bacterium]|jgi:hypothetical protein|nr:pirin family protein [Myxococcota bacterium]